MKVLLEEPHLEKVPKPSAFQMMTWPRYDPVSCVPCSAWISIPWAHTHTHLTFAILLPPQLDSYFGHVYRGLRALARCLTDDSFSNLFQQTLERNFRTKIQGPTRKFQKLLGGIFADNVRQPLYKETPNIEKWAHELRGQMAHWASKKSSKKQTSAPPWCRKLEYTMFSSLV